MEIDTQQMEALLRLQSLQAEQAARKPQGGSAEAFGSALSEALSGAGTVQGPADGVNSMTAGAAVTYPTLNPGMAYFFVSECS